MDFKDGVIVTFAGMYVHIKLGHCFTCIEYKAALGVALLGVVCGAPITAGVLAIVNNMLAYSLSETYKTIYIQYMNRRDQNEAIALQKFHNMVDEVTDLLASFTSLSLQMHSLGER
ncbi:UNVERIFIED_CONTAM: hypothetical protein FKN15_019893 [Acipenser sinensis]